MTPNFTELDYYPDSTLDLFQSISNTNWSMLLYSGNNSTYVHGRFDILVTNPILTLVTKNNITTISDKHTNFTSNLNPFTLLKKYTNTFKLQHIKDHDDKIPFQGGFLGIFGYDLVRYIEQLPKIAQSDLSFPDMALGLYRWAIISDHKLCKSYLISNDNPKPILHWIKKQTQKINSSSEMTFQILKPWKSNINNFEYSKKFRFIKKNLILGNCYQVCLSQRFFAPYIGNEWAVYRYLLQYNQVPFSAFIRLPNQLSILSFSPERFIQLRNSEIITQPIKGTLPKLKNMQDDQNQIIKLSKSIKNQSENLMIVDLLRNDIGKVSIPGSVHVSKLFTIQSFSGVHHMVSTIKGTLRNNLSACDLLRACFPGGSITGAPKIQAMKLIEQLEPQRRNVWSGSIGYLSYCGNMDTNITIRTILAEKENFFCSVGSGIIFDSEENIEYQEMLDKISTLLNPLLTI